jgi:hypothetical protein
MCVWEHEWFRFSTDDICSWHTIPSLVAIGLSKQPTNRHMPGVHLDLGFGQ